MTAAAQAFAEINVMSCIVILLTMLLRNILSAKMPSAAMMLLWSLVLARLLLPFNITSPVHVADLFPQKAHIEPIQTENAVSQPSSPPHIQDSPAVYGAEAASSSPAAGRTADSAASQEAGLWEKALEWIGKIPMERMLLVLWLAGAAVVLIHNMIKAISFRKRRLSLCRPVTDKVLLRIMQNHRRRLGIRRQIGMMYCDFVSMPSVFGWIKPCVLIPPQVAQRIDMEKMSMVLLHEACHIKRHDILFMRLWLIVKALHWYNPLVWLAYRMVRQDIELCCDRKVIKTLGERGVLRYSQTLISLSKAMTQADPLATSVSFCRNGSKLKGRVMRMIHPGKRSNFAVVLTGFTALMMIVGCFTTACQKTPEELIVQQKKKEEFNQAVRQTAALSTPGSTPNSADPVAPNPNMAVLEHWTETVKNGKGTTTLNIDADVNVPSGNGLPVIKLVRKQFTGKQLYSIIQTFAGDNRLFIKSEGDVLTKEDIMQEIIKLKQEMTDLNSDMAQNAGITSLDELKKEGDKEVKQLEEMYNNAPDKEPEAVVKEFTLSDLAPDTDAVTIMPGGFSIDFGADGIGQMNIGQTISSTVVSFVSPRCPIQSVDTLGRIGFISDSDALKYGEEIKTPVGIDANKAKETANKLLGNLGISGMGIYSIEPGRYVIYDNSSNVVKELPCYQVTIYRCVNNTFLPDIMGREGKASEEQYAPDIPKESIHIYIDDKGIVKFQWRNPLDAIETVNQNVKILDFKDIQKLFTQQFFNKYSYVPSGDVESYTFNIDKIELGLVLLIEPDQKDEYIAVPAWDFYGETLMKYNKQAFEKMKDSMKDDIEKSVGDVKQLQITDNDEVVERLPYTYATINAVTGAIINRYLGY